MYCQEIESVNYGDSYENNGTGAIKKELNESEESTFPDAATSSNNISDMSTYIPKLANDETHWRKLMPPMLRNHLVHKAVRVIIPLRDPASKLSDVMAKFCTFMVYFENEIYKNAKSRDEYYHLMAKRTHKILTELHDTRAKLGLEARWRLELRELRRQHEQERRNADPIMARQIRRQALPLFIPNKEQTGQFGAKRQYLGHLYIPYQEPGEFDLPEPRVGYVPIPNPQQPAQPRFVQQQQQQQMGPIIIQPGPKSMVPIETLGISQPLLQQPEQQFGQIGKAHPLEQQSQHVGIAQPLEQQPEHVGIAQPLQQQPIFTGVQQQRPPIITQTMGGAFFAFEETGAPPIESILHTNSQNNQFN